MTTSSGTDFNHDASVNSRFGFKAAHQTMSYEGHLPYLIVATKRPGADPLRAATRLDHLHYMIANLHRIVFGGSFEDADGRWGGMMLILDSINEIDTRQWLSHEPYTRAGLFNSIQVTPFRQLAPEPRPGILQRELTAQIRADDASEGHSTGYVGTTLGNSGQGVDSNADL